VIRNAAGVPLKNALDELAPSPLFSMSHTAFIEALQVPRVDVVAERFNMCAVRVAR
jgi:hypothetical protein